MALSIAKVSAWKRTWSKGYKRLYDDGMIDPYHFKGSGAPVDATTLAGIAPTGAEYIDTAAGIAYRNINTQASPTWQATGNQTT